MEEELNYEIYVKIFLSDDENHWKEYGVGMISIEKGQNEEMDIMNERNIVVRYNEELCNSMDNEKLKANAMNDYSDEEECFLLKSRVNSNSNYEKQIS